MGGDSKPGKKRSTTRERPRKPYMDVIQEKSRKNGTGVTGLRRLQAIRETEGEGSRQSRGCEA